MPYIKPDVRHELQCNYRFPDTPGELNFLLTHTILKYWKEQNQSYQTINDISGAMTECLAEFRRRVVVPYETQKAHDNGDVYE